MTDVKLEEFSKYELGEMAKVCGARIDRWKLPEVMDKLELQNCTQDFISIVKFVKDSQRNGISTFLTKITQIFTKYVTSLPEYQRFDADACKAKSEFITNELKGNTSYTLVKPFEHKDGLDKHYISCDIVSANFTCLKMLLRLDVNLTWPEFFASLIPFDERGKSKQNIKSGTAGQKCTIPECIYKSKHVRVHVLSCLDKLQILWEHEALLLAKWIFETNKVPDFKCLFSIKSDEVVIQTFNESLMRIISTYPTIGIFRVRGYLLKSIAGFSIDSMVKIYDDGTFALYNVPAKCYCLALTSVKQLLSQEPKSTTGTLKK